MKKPKWAKCRRYKIVLKEGNCSPITFADRISDKGDVGSILQYYPRTIVVSPNGVNKSSRRTCARGIHAYKSGIHAYENRSLIRWEKIITVWAAKWYGKSCDNKCRAYRVWVGEAWYGENYKTSSTVG